MSKRNELIQNGQIETVLLVDWLTEHQNKLDVLRNKYIKDTGEQIDPMEFALFIYRNGRELVENPQLN